MGAVATGWATANALSVMVRARMIEFATRTSRIFPLFAQETNYQGLTLGIRRWPDFFDDVEDMTEGTDFTNISDANSRPTTVQATPGITGMGIEISDLLESADPASVAGGLEQQFRGCVIQQVDLDLALLFNTLNGGTTVGATNADATLSGFIDGMVLLQASGADGEIFSVVAPRQAGDLGLHTGGFMTSAVQSTDTGVTTLGAGGAAGTQTASLLDRLNNANGQVGSIAGVPVIVSNQVQDDATDEQGVIAVPDALTTTFKWMARPETERHAMGVSQFLVVSSAYSCDETASTFGIPFETGV